MPSASSASYSLEQIYEQRRGMQAQIDALTLPARRIEQARALLGTPQTATMPPPLVESARAAIRAQNAAQRAMDDAERQAAAWIAKYKPSDLLRQQKYEELTIEAATALRDATAAADRALAELGRVAADLSAIRTELAAIPQEQRADDASHAMRRQGRITREKDLRAKLAGYGLLD